MTANTKKLTFVEEKQGTNIIYGFGILKILIHLFTLEGYGLHADELYYIELGQHFRWGFLDISPFVTWIAGISEYLFGNSTTSFRILPCLFSAATVILTGHITQLFGGKKLAIVIACSAIICSPAFLATSYLLQPAVFDQFFWALIGFSIIAYGKNQKLIYLYLCAFAFGFGMLNKFSILLFVGSAGCAWIFIQAKSFRLLKIKELTGPVVLFLLIILPNLLWQFSHDFPVFNYTLKVGVGAFHIEIWDYLFQLLLFHGASLAVWSAGFLYLLLDQNDQKPRKIWAVSFIMIILFLALLKGKLYYGLGAFPILFAAGGLCWSLMLEKIANMSKILFISSIYLFALLSFPIVVPLFSLNLCRKYIKEMVKLTGFSRPLRYEDGTTGQIPQFFADMSDWDMLARKIDFAIRTFPPAEPNAMTILTENYALAGALKYYKGEKKYVVISAHNSFLMDSPKALQMPTLIYLSKSVPAEVMKLANEVLLIDSLKSGNSHLNGIYIYRLKAPNAHFKEKYLRDRVSFYPGLESKQSSNKIFFN